MWCNTLLENLVYLKYYITLIIVRLTDFIHDTFIIPYHCISRSYRDLLIMFVYHIDDVYYNIILLYSTFYSNYFLL